MKRQINADELDVFYRLIGASVWHIQYLEDVLVQYLVIRDLKVNPAGSEAEAYERLAKMRRCVLGSVYKCACDSGVIPRSLQTCFERFVDERNWLIHRSRQDSSARLYDDELRRQMFTRISAIEEESVRLRRLIYDELTKFMSSEGFDLKLVEQTARENLRRLVEP